MSTCRSWHVINPEILPVGEEVESGWEGLPQHSRHPRQGRAAARRFVCARSTATGRRIELVAHGLPARVIQHENDHLDGVLFFDRMASFETLTFMDEFRRYWAKDDEE